MPNKKGVVLFILIAIVILLLLLVRTISLLPQANQNSSNNNSNQTFALQTEVEEVVDQYQPVVVSIVASKDVPTVKNCTLEPGVTEFGELGIIQRCTIENSRVNVSGGTGFVVAGQGIILTNKHVVGDEQAEYTVLFNDGGEEKVVNIYRDPDTDIALLRINKNLSSVAVLGDSNTVRLGHFVVAVGNALGEFRNTSSFGIISGLDRTIAAGDQLGSNVEVLERVIQTDAAINPGNSGGPLINLEGQVIAVNTAKAQTAENIGFAIPINDVKPIVESFSTQ